MTRGGTDLPTVAMPLASIDAVAALSRLDEFSTIIDARSESEFAEDHLPGAVNWPSLTDAERLALEETVAHAALSNGQSILELGCGWGSLTLWMAERYPRSRITAVSNSSSQREHIEAEAVRRELANVEVLTADINGFDSRQRFDRVVSLCDRVREMAPEHSGRPPAIHWSCADPAAGNPDHDATYPAFQRLAGELKTRVRFLIASLGHQSLAA